MYTYRPNRLDLSYKPIKSYIITTIIILLPSGSHKFAIFNVVTCEYPWEIFFSRFAMENRYTRIANIY